MSKGQISSKEGNKRWMEKNPEKVRESGRMNSSKWSKKNRDKINKRIRDNKRGVELLCEIREKHLEDMKDDSESLTAEFLNTIQNLDCKKHESSKSLRF